MHITDPSADMLLSLIHIFGHLNKAGVSPKKYLREFALDNGSEMELGAVIKADMFQVGDFVDVTGTSKGHGYERCV